MSQSSLLLLSTSTIHGSEFLDYCLDEVRQHFNGLSEILFVPYARPSGISHDKYTETVANKFREIGINVKGLHEFENARSVLKDYKGIYIGGGNTFLLLKKLYELDLIESIRSLVQEGALKYMGSSAGTLRARR